MKLNSILKDTWAVEGGGLMHDPHTHQSMAQWSKHWKQCLQHNNRKILNDNLHKKYNNKLIGELFGATMKEQDEIAWFTRSFGPRDRAEKNTREEETKSGEGYGEEARLLRVCSSRERRRLYGGSFDAQKRARERERLSEREKL